LIKAGWHRGSLNKGNWTFAQSKSKIETCLHPAWMQTRLLRRCVHWSAQTRKREELWNLTVRNLVVVSNQRSPALDESTGQKRHVSSLQKACKHHQWPLYSLICHFFVKIALLAFLGNFRLQLHHWTPLGCPCSSLSSVVNSYLKLLYVLREVIWLTKSTWPSQISNNSFKENETSFCNSERRTNRNTYGTYKRVAWWRCGRALASWLTGRGFNYQTVRFHVT